MQGVTLKDSVNIARLNQIVGPPSGKTPKAMRPPAWRCTGGLLFVFGKQLGIRPRCCVWFLQRSRFFMR
jgi:hypothetical protein